MKRLIAILLVLAAMCPAALAQTLKLDDTGSEVSALQQRLVDLAYLNGKVDGIYGKRTVAAVKLFQEMHGLEITGRADDETQALIFSEDTQPIHGSLAKGDKGDAVTELQQRLYDYGFTEDEPDGAYGKITTAAVTTLQNLLIDQGAQDITADGAADPRTLEYFYSDDFTVYTRDLSLGSAGTDVQLAETRLSKLGYFDETPDERYTDYTRRVVEAFQRDAGLTVNGRMDRATFDRAFADDAPTAARVVTRNISEGDRGLTVKMAQTALLRYGMTADYADGVYDAEMKNAVDRFHEYLIANENPDAIYFEDPSSLTAAVVELLYDGNYYADEKPVTKKSDKADITRLQRRLCALNYLGTREVDGKWGKRTTAAVKTFRTNNGLSEEGGADQEMVDVLFSDDAVGDWTEYKLEVDLSKQRVYAFHLNEDGEYEQVESFICSTGLGGTTPRGVFRSTRKLDRWHYFFEFNCWAQYAYAIVDHIYFHSVIYSSRSESSLRTSSVYALGSPASHGCIRLKVADAQWIYEHCENGTTVVIY